MHILVNAIPMAGLLTGINRYLRNLYQALSMLPEVSISYMTKNKMQKVMPEVANSKIWQQNTNRLRRLPDLMILGGRSFNWLRHEHRVRHQLRMDSYNIYHETAFTPAAINGLVPQVFTLHDLSLLHWRDMHPRERIWFADIFMHRRLKEADHIITPSEYIRRELNETMKIPITRITAIPEAADHCFRIIPASQVEATLKRRQLPTNYILFVGSLEPRKNIDTLISALALTNSDIPLVLTGWSGWGEKKWLAEINRLNLAGRVFNTGHVSDAELVALYNGAAAVVYPSLYEGFGLPIIEAMACGAAVITSNRASMPEVAGDGAILLNNPLDPEELADAIDTLVQQNTRRDELKRRGRLQAASFSWQRTARATLALFQQLM